MSDEVEKSPEVTAAELGIPIPEISIEGLVDMVLECEVLMVDSRRTASRADQGRLQSYESRQGRVEAARLEKKAKRIIRILNKVVPLPDDESWKDVIVRRIEGPKSESEEATTQHGQPTNGGAGL